MDLKVNQIAARLQDMNAEHIFFNMKGRGVNVWFIEEFKTQDEPHDLPEFKDNLL